MQKIAFQGLKFSKIFEGGACPQTPLGDCLPSAGWSLQRAIVLNLTHFQNRKLEGLLSSPSS